MTTSMYGTEGAVMRQNRTSGLLSLTTPGHSSAPQAPSTPSPTLQKLVMVTQRCSPIALTINRATTNHHSDGDFAFAVGSQARASICFFLPSCSSMEPPAHHPRSAIAHGNLSRAPDRQQHWNIHESRDRSGEPRVSEGQQDGNMFHVGGGGLLNKFGLPMTSPEYDLVAYRFYNLPGTK